MPQFDRLALETITKFCEAPKGALYTKCDINEHQRNSSLPLQIFSLSISESDNQLQKCVNWELSVIVV